jgi:diguanylate cyclase (GGDEF)-like protein
VVYSKANDEAPDSRSDEPPLPAEPVHGLQHLKALTQGRNGFGTAIAAVLVLAGILAAVLGALSVASSDTAKTRLAFRLTSAEVASTLGLAIQREEDLVVSASAFVTASTNVSASDFDRWAESVRAMRRYPELQNIGLLKLVPASGLASFKAHMAADPLRPFGPRSVAPQESLAVQPPGERPYYCFAVAGLARSAASYIPANLDYCALAPALITGRDTGLPSYAPFADGSSTTLGVETPVYRGGVVPLSLSDRQREFVGWVGELLEPGVVLERARAGHANLAVSFRYDSASSHVEFISGSVPAHPQSATISLGNGWTVQSFGAAVGGGVFADTNALSTLIGGTLLSLLFGLLLLVLATGRGRALSLVREKTRELSYQALHDALTGLPNRALVLDRAEQLLARGARDPSSRAGALFIDIDGFKQVNDNLGHAAGDQLLRIVGERLKGALREQDTVGRIGGDEFVVLIEAPDVETTLDLLAERLTKVLRAPAELDDGRKISSVTASIGIAVGAYASSDALLRDADLALYAAKAAGKDRYALFDPSMYTHA